LAVLENKHKKILVQDSLGIELKLPKEWHCTPKQLTDRCDLIVVVGGDGSMLNAGRLLAETQVPVLGINRGGLGFLTDIEPSKLEEKVDQVLTQKYKRAERFLLNCSVYHDDKKTNESSALNDVVLFPGEISRMIEFEVYVDKKFLYNQRSDGLIVSTPTGSTAYSLSAGGPILHPKLDALVLVPICPHTLSSRPIVINGSSKVDIIVSKLNQDSLQVSCDGQIQIPVNPGAVISIEKAKNSLQLLHPVDYDYYHILRTKLGWSSKNSN
jgi:NAD+ kinase